MHSITRSARTTGSISAACLVWLLLAPAGAAELKAEASPQPGPTMLSLHGEIVAGDLPRMEAKIEELERQKPGTPIVLALHSPGGDHFAGLRIALLLRRKGVATVVLPDRKCFSACSSVFFGGYDLKAGKPDRTAYETAQVGVHQMTMVPKRNKPIPEHARVRVFNAAQRTLTDLEVSLHIQGKLFDTDPKDIYLLTPDEMTASTIKVRKAERTAASGFPVSVRVSSIQEPARVP